MKALKFLIPLVLFGALVGFFEGPVPRSARGALAPDRQAGARVRADPARPARPDDPPRRHAGQGVDAQCRASWPECCRDEHPYLVEFAKLKALPIYGLDYKDQREPAQAWLAERGNPYESSLFDANGRVGIDFGVYGVPETFIIDKQGVIRFKQIGALTPEVLNGKVLPLLRKLNG